MNEMRELNADELQKVEGGMMPAWFQDYLDNVVGAMTGGLVGYGPNGFEGPYHTAYKNPPGGP